MLYNHTSELAIRATLFLALQPPGKLSPVHEIAKGTGLSEPYLAKILRRLTAAGLVRAFRGPGRGMELGRSPETITLWAVVRAVEGPAQPEWCALGLQACSEQSPCPLHNRWVPLRTEVQRILNETTLASLAQELRQRMDKAEPTWVRLGNGSSRGRAGERKKRKPGKSAADSTAA